MPRPKKHTALVTEAHAKLTILEAQLESDRSELARLEQDHREAVARRAGVAAIASAAQFAEAAMAQLEATVAEHDALMQEIPRLEAASDREESIADLLRASKEGAQVEADIRALVDHPETSFKDLLEDLVATNLRLEKARVAYHTAGRDLTHDWDSKSEGRKAIERELREKGANLVAVTAELEPDKGRTDLSYQMAWHVFQKIQLERRRELIRAEQERLDEVQRAKSEALNRRLEEHEQRSYSAVLTYPAAVKREVLEALSSLQIKGSEVVRYRLPGAVERYAEQGRLGIAQPDVVAARSLLYERLGKEYVVENILFANDPQSGWDPPHA